MTDLSRQLRELIDDGARPLTTTDIAARTASAENHIPKQRSRGRVAVAAVSVIAVAGAGAMAAGLLSDTGTGTGPGHPAGRPGQPGQQAVLTARVVRHLAQSSKAALASAGHVLVSYVNSANGGTIVSGTENITFSGQDYNAVSRQSGSKIGPWTDRVVNRQIYEHGRLAPGRAPHWYHSVNETSGGQSVPDPRRLLTALQPGAGFRVLGWQTLDGVRVEHLRATRTAALPGPLLSAGEEQPGEHLATLDAWVDGHGVIRQLHMVFAGSGTAAFRTVETVRFLNIGRPETITAPRHYLNQVTHG